MAAQAKPLGVDDIAVTSRVASSAASVMKQLDTLDAATAALTALLGGDLKPLPTEDGTAAASELLPLHPPGDWPHKPGTFQTLVETTRLLGLLSV